MKKDALRFPPYLCDIPYTSPQVVVLGLGFRKSRHDAFGNVLITVVTPLQVSAFSISRFSLSATSKIRNVLTFATAVLGHRLLHLVLREIDLQHGFPIPYQRRQGPPSSVHARRRTSVPTRFATYFSNYFTEELDILHPYRLPQLASSCWQRHITYHLP